MHYNQSKDNKFEIMTWNSIHQDKIIIVVTALTAGNYVITERTTHHKKYMQNYALVSLLLYLFLKHCP